MPPNSMITTTIQRKVMPSNKPSQIPEATPKPNWGGFKTPLIWTNIFFIFLVHFISIIALVTFPYFQKMKTFWWSYLTGILGGFGVTGGAHRFWTHKSYKAKLPLRIILIICYSLAGQNRLKDWVRDHRVHHKFSETDADPHNANRGFFFAHVGWLMMRKHPEVIKKGRTIDCTDLLEDSVVVFFEKYFLPMKIFFCFVLPTLVPYLLWNETFYWSVLSTLVRYTFGLNFTWLVNSAAHIYGNRPYNKHIQPVENLFVSIVAMGEGWHNYHHTFPWDYKAAELGSYGVNFTTLFLDFFAKIGWAYDLKSPPKHLVQKVKENHGDGSIAR